MDYQKILEDIALEVEPMLLDGKVADYIAALGGIDPNQFAMTITLFDGTQYSVGKSEKLFSIQSISKVFTYTLALRHHSKEFYKRVGHEPSGDPFNSLVQLEYENGVPRNPFINAGAINVTDALITHWHSPKSAYNEIIEFICSIADNQEIDLDEIVALPCNSWFRSYYK